MTLFVSEEVRKARMRIRNSRAALLCPMVKVQIVLEEQGEKKGSSINRSRPIHGYDDFTTCQDRQRKNNKETGKGIQNHLR